VQVGCGPLENTPLQRFVNNARFGMARFAQVIDSNRLAFILQRDKLDKQDNQTADNHDKLD
jgi:hypothetical protein